jgi:hypothetical protein
MVEGRAEKGKATELSVTPESRRGDINQ